MATEVRAPRWNNFLNNSQSMKKIFASLAIAATFVGCVKESTPSSSNVHEAMSIVASIECGDTRVSVEGEKFTDVKWEMGDKITLVSEAGVNVVMQSESAGDSDVRFKGDSAYVGDVDTYYAVYPAVAIDNYVATIDLREQSGYDAAMLVSVAREVAKGDVPMSFTPANALLHVAVSGAESLTKAEFSAFDGSAIASTFSYDFTTETTSMGGNTEAYVVDAPAAEGFFFSLPADLDMSNGYVVTLTDAAGNVCSKAYNGKTFARGTTTRVEIAWSTPVVTLVAPKTSYSYYAEGNSSKANSCANNAIYFDGASTYANIQSAMVAEAGFIVDGKEYAATIDTASKSFTMGNVTVASWGAKSVEAYIKTKDGRTIKSAPQTVYITGLPYNFQFYQKSDNDVDNEGWKRNGEASIKEKLMTLKEGGLAGDDNGWVASPAYYAPATISTNVTINAKYYVAALSPSGKKATLYVGETTSNTSSSSSASSIELTGTNNTSSGDKWTAKTVSIDLHEGTRYVSINHNDATYRTGSRIYLCSFKLEYK